MLEGVLTGLIVAIIVETVVYVRRRRERGDARTAIQREIQRAQDDIARDRRRGFPPSIAFDSHLHRFQGLLMAHSDRLDADDFAELMQKIEWAKGSASRKTLSETEFSVFSKIYLDEVKDILLPPP